MSEGDAWLRWNPPPFSEEQHREYARRFGHTIERWLDAGEGACLLRDPAVAGIVGSAFSHFDGNRCDLHSWVVMPNHMHLLVSLREGQTLTSLMQSWKGFTSRAINRLLDRSGTLWQKDYYDRLIRNGDHFWNCANYIRNNPTKARLGESDYFLQESDLIRKTLGEATSKSPSSHNLQKQGDSEVASPGHD